MSWRPDASAPLWHLSKGEENKIFFSDLELEHLKQIGPSCVATTLCMIARATGADVTPEDFKKDYRSMHGAGFSISPTFTQSAWFRYHNRDPHLDNLYFAAAGAHPGAGMPGVLCSAKVVEKLVDTETIMQT